jgi:hypothetical protein
VPGPLADAVGGVQTRAVPQSFQEVVAPVLEPLLAAGESLEGVVAATRRSTFSGGMVAIGVTNRRLIVQPLTRKHEPGGVAESVTAEDVASMWGGVAGSEWWSAEQPVTGAALTIRLRRTDGRKMVLDLMRGGDGLLGRLGGGEAQEQGVAALAEWMRRAAVEPS